MAALFEIEGDLRFQIVEKIAAALQITGPFNMQLIAKDGDVKIIETNLRASRSCRRDPSTILIYSARTDEERARAERASSLSP